MRRGLTSPHDLSRWARDGRGPDRRAGPGRRQGHAAQALSGLRSDRFARVWFGATALAVLAGLVTQVQATATNDEGYFDTAPARLANLLCFFTVQSNVVVMVTTALLAVSLNRPGALFAAFRLIGVVGITITFVVFHVALSGLQDLQGTAKVADQLLHTVSPVMCVLGWLVWGPRGLVSRRVALWSLAYPVLWLAGTLARGLVTGYYPYPFLDVDEHGGARVTVNVLAVAAVFVAVTCAAWSLDRVIPSSRTGSANR